jgi:hypothetical protein
MRIETQIDFPGIYVKIGAVKIGDIKVHGNSKRKCDNQYQNQLERNKGVSMALKGLLKVTNSMCISVAQKS